MTNAELFAAVERWAQANYGRPAESVAIRVCGIPKRISFPILIAAQPVPARERERGNRHEDEPLPLCVQEILQTLREAAKPLSLTLLKQEMDRRGRSYSRSTLAHYCAELVQDGTLENPEEARPRGYRLPEEGEE